MAQKNLSLYTVDYIITHFKKVAGMHFIKESVLVSALRAFCSSFMSVLGILLAAILIFFGLMTSLSGDLSPEKSILTILPDADGNRKVLPMDTPAVLCLKIDGEIGLKDLTAPTVRNLLLESREGLLAGDRVKAVLLYIDSPGGTAIDSDDIYRAVRDYSTKYKIPVYAYVNGLCASGGMYIACAAQKIYATQSSIIGSVGVRLGPAFNFSQFMDRHGVQSVTLTEGKDKDMLNPFRPWKEGEDQSLKDVMAAQYDIFVNVVTSARPNLSKEKLINTYGAQVFAATTAKEYGYIDVVEDDYSAALKALVETAGIEKEYQVVELSFPHSVLSDLSSGSFTKACLKLMGFPSVETNPLMALRGKLLYYEPLTMY